MSWEQHRFAVERARTMREKAAEAINGYCMDCKQQEAFFFDGRCLCPDGKPTFAGVTLQGEANSSDAELLGDVADFLKSLEGSKPTMPRGEEFVADWNKAICELSNFCAKWDLPKPDMVFHQSWRGRMSKIAGTQIGSPIIYAGVRVRFGRFESCDVLRP